MNLIGLSEIKPFENCKGVFCGQLKHGKSVIHQAVVKVFQRAALHPPRDQEYHAFRGDFAEAKIQRLAGQILSEVQWPESCPTVKVPEVLYSNHFNSFEFIIMAYVQNASVSRP